jgi:hypothetical protein
MPTLLKLVHEIEREVTLPDSFYASNIKLIPKQNKYTTKEDNCSQFFNKH